MTVKLDRALHSQTDIFGNRRTPDPLAKQIVEGLNTFGEFSYFESHVFPPNLIYFDKKMNQDHIHEFLSRMKIDHLENEERYEQKKELRKVQSCY